MISSSSTTRTVPLLGPAMLLRGAPGRDLLERKRHGELGALADGAVALDRALMVADDAVGDGQPEAGAAADRLRREKRVVDARQIFRGNARAGVGNFHDDHAVFIESRGHRQPSAVWHR